MTDTFMTPEQRLTALAELETRQRHNQKRAVWAAWGSIIVAVVVLAVLMVSIFFLNREAEQLTQRNDQLTKTNTGIENELKEKREQLSSVNDELTQKQNLLAAVQQKLGTDNVADAKKLIVTAEETSKITPRIFFHIRSEDQLLIARQLAEKFRDKGYAVPKAEILVDKGPARTEIRYFHQNASEREEATRLARDIGDEASVKFISGYENSPLVKPRQFEVWLHRDHE